ncbi:MAG: lysylphosphatidylglycerol synthase transmembrane domain-containing protein [Candidatus Thermoplasmatota archaeon]|jgi:hypothetical protein|nr:flippase-like domain-containing protein [Thermoplasmatales archaeon]
MIEKIKLKNIGKLFPIIGIIIFIYIITDIGIEKIGSAFSSIPLEYFLLALLLFIPRWLLSSYKWYFISKKQKMDFKLFFLSKIFLITLFLGSITPGAIGLHLRIYYLKTKSKASLEKCLTNSLIESGLSLITGLLIAFIGSIILIELYPELPIIILPFFIFYLSVFIVLLEKRGGSKLFNILIRPFIPERYKTSIDKSVESLYQDIPKIKDMLIPFLIEIIVWIFAAIQVYIIAQAFLINITFYEFILISIISVVISNILPISIGGLGIREGAFVFLLSKFGVQSEVAFVISISGFLVKILIPGLIGLIISFRKKMIQ